MDAPIIYFLFFQIYPIEKILLPEDSSNKQDLKTKMCELDVFVGNYAIIDWEVYSLWLSGRSIAEAVTVFVRDNRALISDYHVSQDIIVSDFEDNWRLFSTLETALYSQESTLPLQLLDSAMKKRVIESYHSLDAVFCREILGRKLNSKLRKDLDEVSEKTGIFVRACRRQFDNIKKVFKARWTIYLSILSLFT